MELDNRKTAMGIASGAVAAAQGCIDASGAPLAADYLPPPLAATRVAGTQWGIPLYDMPQMLLYNQTAFQKAGLNGAPTTLDQLVLDARTLHNTGVAHPVGSLFPLGLFTLSGVDLFDRADGSAGLPTRSVFATPTGTRVATAISQLLSQAIPKQEANADPMADIHALGSGEAAIAVHSAWVFKGIDDALSGGQAPGVHLAVAPLPGLAGPPAILLDGASLFLSGRANPQQRAASWAFLQWLETPGEQTRAALAEGWLPPRRSVGSDPAVVAQIAHSPLLAATWAMMTGPTRWANLSVLVGRTSSHPSSWAGPTVRSSRLSPGPSIRSPTAWPSPPPWPPPSEASLRSTPTRSASAWAATTRLVAAACPEDGTDTRTTATAEDRRHESLVLLEQVFVTTGPTDCYHPATDPRQLQRDDVAVVDPVLRTNAAGSPRASLVGRPGSDSGPSFLLGGLL
jgi:Bacterial extracellular solute-binding protein